MSVQAIANQPFCHRAHSTSPTSRFSKPNFNWRPCTTQMPLILRHYNIIRTPHKLHKLHPCCSLTSTLLQYRYFQSLPITRDSPPNHPTSTTSSSSTPTHILYQTDRSRNPSNRSQRPKTKTINRIKNSAQLQHNTFVNP